MKIATISHSHVATRQQRFFEEVARPGNEVLMVAPGEWKNLRAKDYSFLQTHEGKPTGSFSLRTCRHTMGEDIYQYHLLGAQAIVEEFDPDWLYIQAEPGSSLADEALMWNVKKRAIFTWENIVLRGVVTSLKKWDVVICGNSQAVGLVTPWNNRVEQLLQVGVDTDHFCARPGVTRDIKVGYIGRMVPEKGLPYLVQAYPTVKFMENIPWLDLPWYYSQIETIVAFSQDIPYWREQAPNYVILEALACGCKGVISDTFAMKEGCEGAPGVVIVEGHKQAGKEVDLGRVIKLREGIDKALKIKVGTEGRQWVINNYSNKVIAEKLINLFNKYSPKEATNAKES